MARPNNNPSKGIGSNNKIARGGKKSNNKQVESYQEEEEEMEEEEEEGLCDATQDDDPVSTHELAAVLKAFTRGRNKKAADGSKIIDKQIQDLIESTRTDLDTWILKETNKCDAVVDNLNLDDETVLEGFNAIAYANIIHELSNEFSANIDALDTLVEAYNPEGKEYYPKTREYMIRRNINTKKNWKKHVKNVRQQQAEQLEMARMYSEAGPTIYKHFKAIVRA